VATQAAGLPGRIRGFVRWVVRTPWPVFSLSMLQADIIGALFVLGFLRYGLPPQDRIQLQDLPALNLTIFAISLIVVFLAGFMVNLKMLMPVFRWQRRDNLLADADPAAETADDVARRIRKALGFIEPARLIPGPDCGMKYLPRESASGKLRAMTEAATRLRAELGG